MNTRSKEAGYKVFITELAAKMLRSGFQELPKMPPRSFHDAPKSFQNEPKIAPRSPKMHSRSPQRGAKIMMIMMMMMVMMPYE